MNYFDTSRATVDENGIPREGFPLRLAIVHDVSRRLSGRYSSFTFVPHDLPKGLLLKGHHYNEKESSRAKLAIFPVFRISGEEQGTQTRMEIVPSCLREEIEEYVSRLKQEFIERGSKLSIINYCRIDPLLQNS